MAGPWWRPQPGPQEARNAGATDMGLAGRDVQSAKWPGQQLCHVLEADRKAGRGAGVPGAGNRPLCSGQRVGKEAEAAQACATLHQGPRSCQARGPELSVPAGFGNVTGGSGCRRGWRHHKHLVRRGQNCSCHLCDLGTAPFCSAHPAGCRRAGGVSGTAVVWRGMGGHTHRIWQLLQRPGIQALGRGKGGQQLSPKPEALPPPPGSPPCLPRPTLLPQSPEVPTLPPGVGAARYGACCLTTPLPTCCGARGLSSTSSLHLSLQARCGLPEAGHRVGLSNHMVKNRGS